MNPKLDTLLNSNDKKPKKNSPFKSLLSGLSLAIVSIVCVVVIILAKSSTSQIIEQNESNSTLKKLSLLLPVEAQQEGVALNCYEIKANRFIGHNQKLFVATIDNDIKGYVLTYATSLGYSNPLIFIAGFSADKKVNRVDIQFSNETPGLGDKIDRKHGDFLDQFNGFGLDDKKWDVKKSFGDFDFITGSTVTSRASVVATKQALRALDELDISKLKKCK